MRNQAADFVRFDARHALRHHPRAIGLNFTWNASCNAFRHGKRFLPTNRIGNPTGFRFGHSPTCLKRHASGAFFRNHFADLVGHFLDVCFADGPASPHRDLFNDFLRNHAADGIRHFGDNCFGNHSTNRNRANLTNDLRLIRGARDLTADNIRAPDPTARIESGHLGHTDLGASAGTTRNQPRAAGTRMIDLLLLPLSAILLHRPISCDRLHDRVAAFLIHDFGLLAHDCLVAFSFECLGHWSLNTATNFACRFVPDLSLRRIGLIAIHGFRDGTHHGVTFFTFGRLVNLTIHLVFLIAVGDFADRSLAGFLDVFVGSLVNGPTDRILLWFLNCVVNGSLTGLSFHAARRVATGLLTGGCRTAAIARGAAVTTGRSRLRRDGGGEHQRQNSSDHCLLHINVPPK